MSTTSDSDRTGRRPLDAEEFRAILDDLIRGPGLDIERMVRSRRGDEPAEEFEARASCGVTAVLSYVSYALGIAERGEGARPGLRP